MKKIILAVALAISLASKAHADPETVAAVLPNEEAECKFLVDLCSRANSVALAAQAARVAKVIRFKHEKAPACLADCRNNFGQILDMNAPVWK
jgi:hypothetical protein